MKLGLCQMPVTASKAENGAAMRRYVRDAAAAGCDLVALPEMSLFSVVGLGLPSA